MKIKIDGTIFDSSDVKNPIVITLSKEERDLLTLTLQDFEREEDEAVIIIGSGISEERMKEFREIENVILSKK